MRAITLSYWYFFQSLVMIIRVRKERKVLTWGKEFQKPKWSSSTIRHPLRKKLRMRWFFDVSKVKELNFFNRPSVTPLRFFMRIFLKIPILAHPAFIFQRVFISRSFFESNGFIAYSKEWDLGEKSMFIHNNQPLITSFYIKKSTYFLPN